uniref:PDZ domain-containing protein n=1 Tax=Timema poppense TaxID=170557 RepID=A0A7R9CJU6_TIMPO|nr:unnamed protein product [Timema poppensis]
MSGEVGHPLSWQVSSDGTRMIGHMILKKTVREGVGPTSSAAILGLKVVGGKLLENGGRGALIEKVKKGSTADIEGQLRPGDEVIEWNGRSLQGKSFQEVYDIIAESKQEPQVELIVSRSMGNRRTAQAHWRHTQSSPTPIHKGATVVGVSDQPVEVDAIPPNSGVEISIPLVFEEESGTENVILMESYEPTPKRKKNSLLEKYETEVSRPLNNSELQRLVLLKQLRVLELKEKKLMLELGE